MSSKEKGKTIMTNWETIVAPYCSPYWNNSNKEG
jgi:hypothetical protein